jgi:hypothetical protein
LYLELLVSLAATAGKSRQELILDFRVPLEISVPIISAHPIDLLRLFLAVNVISNSRDFELNAVDLVGVSGHYLSPNAVLVSRVAP